VSWKSYTLRVLDDPTDTYSPPDRGEYYRRIACDCNTVMYSLYMACSACQEGRVNSWALWSNNCDILYYSWYPYRVPQGTAIPFWAFYDIRNLPNQNYSDAVAMSIGRFPEATPESSPLPHKKNIGAIVGGVVGGVILSIVAVVVIFHIRRRRQSRDGGDKPLPEPSWIIDGSDNGRDGGDRPLPQPPRSSRNSFRDGDERDQSLSLPSLNTRGPAFDPYELTGSPPPPYD